MSELNEINVHIEELRKRVVRSVISILVITVFILTFHATPVDVMGITLYYPYPEPLDNIAAQFTNVMRGELVPEGVQLIQTAPGQAFFSQVYIAALIGIAYNLSASYWRTFRIITVPKGILTGAVTGAIVFSLAFLPLHTLVMMPLLETALDSGDSIITILPKEKEALLTLIQGNDFVLWYSAFLHVLFGAVLGLMSGFILHDKYRNVTRIRSFW